MTARLQQAQQQLVAAQQVAADAVSMIQNSLRATFHDRSFTVPGGAPDAQLQSIVQAVLHLKTHCLDDLYEALQPPSQGDGHGDGRGNGHDHGHGG